MALPDYILKLFNPQTGAFVRIYDSTSFDSLRYSRELNGVGSLVLTFPASAQVLADFTLDTLVDVERTSPTTGRLTKEDTYLVRLVHRYREGNQEKIVIGAQHLNHLLMRRIIDPDDDPLAAGGYSTKAGAADSVMRAYIDEQCGPAASADRRFQNLSVATVPGVGINVGRRLRHENLLKILQEIARQSSIDFTIERTSGNQLEVQVGRIGSDKTKSTNYPFTEFVMFNPDRGNISNPSLLSDRKEEANFVYALGQGPGDNRIVFKRAGNGIADSPYNRIEMTKDVRIAERGNSLEILTEAREALKEKEAITEFTFDINGAEGGAVYQLNWFLGDSVTARWDSVEYDLRISGVEINIAPDGETINVTTEVL